MRNEEDYRIFAKLQNGEVLRDIADDLNVSYSRVVRLNGEFKKAKQNNTIAELLDIGKLSEAVVAEKLAVPSLSEAKELTKGVEGLDRLNTDLQQSALVINTRVATLVANCSSAGELESLAEIVCKLNTAFINPKGTQVNIQNNVGGGSDGTPKYTQFLGDAPC